MLNQNSIYHLRPKNGLDQVLVIAKDGAEAKKIADSTFPKLMSTGKTNYSTPPQYQDKNMVDCCLLEEEDYNILEKEICETVKITYQGNDYVLTKGRAEKL